MNGGVYNLYYWFLFVARRSEISVVAYLFGFVVQVVWIGVVGGSIALLCELVLVKVVFFLLFVGFFFWQ